MHQLRTLGHADARVAIDYAVAECARRGKAAVIAVADVAGALVALERMDGAPPSSVTIAHHKAFTAAQLGAPSRSLGDRGRDQSSGFDIAYFGDSRFTGFGGGLPVLVGDACVGAVALSGLPEQDDIDLCALTITHLLATLTAPPA